MSRVYLDPHRRALYGSHDCLSSTAVRKIWGWYSRQLYGPECHGLLPYSHRFDPGDKSILIHIGKVLRNNAECSGTDFLYHSSNIAHRRCWNVTTTKAASPVPRCKVTDRRGLPRPSLDAGGPVGKNLRRANRHGEKCFQNRPLPKIEQGASSARKSAVVAAYDG